jgi:hypothetical protein
MAAKFKITSETCIFVILFSKLQFPTNFKNFECFQSAFLVSKNFFQKIQNGGFFEDDVIFEKKSTFFKRVLPTLNSTFSNSQKTRKMSAIPPTIVDFAM